MAFCDFCDCKDCKTGNSSHLESFTINHSQCVDGRWICSTCYWYECCIDVIGDICDEICIHRPALITGEWTHWTYSSTEDEKVHNALLNASYEAIANVYGSSFINDQNEYIRLFELVETNELDDLIRKNMDDRTSTLDSSIVTNWLEKYFERYLEVKNNYIDYCNSLC